MTALNSLSVDDICRAALAKIGARPFDSFFDDSPEAACARRLYPMARDLLLCAQPWAFTIATAPLAVTACLGPNDFAYAFALPDDHLRTIAVSANGRGTAYRIEAGRVLSDSHEITLRYQRRVPEAEMPAFFLPLLVTRLAAEFCIPLTQETRRATDLYRLAEAELRTARLIDSQTEATQ